MLSAGSAAEVGSGSDDLNMFKARSVENTVGLRRSVRSAAHVEEQTACKPGFVNRTAAGVPFLQVGGGMRRRPWKAAGSCRGSFRAGLEKK